MQKCKIRTTWGEYNSQYIIKHLSYICIFIHTLPDLYTYVLLKYCILKNHTCILFSIFMTVATSNVLVNEEYLLYDLNNIISAVGGSMGLFLSFSFLNCFMCAFDSLEKKCCGID